MFKVYWKIKASSLSRAVLDHMTHRVFLIGQRSGWLINILSGRFNLTETTASGHTHLWCHSVLRYITATRWVRFTGRSYVTLQNQVFEILNIQMSFCKLQKGKFNTKHYFVAVNSKVFKDIWRYLYALSWWNNASSNQHDWTGRLPVTQKNTNQRQADTTTSIHTWLMSNAHSVFKFKHHNFHTTSSDLLLHSRHNQYSH